MRVKVKFTVKNTVWEESSATAYGVFDCEFDFDSHEGSWSKQGYARRGAGHPCGHFGGDDVGEVPQDIVGVWLERGREPSCMQGIGYST